MESNQAAVASVVGRGLPLPGDDIDTDRIIPARFMKCVTFDDLGQYAFYDERHDQEGNKKDHPYNDSKFEGAAILVVGRNFGCGSSREHAPQSLARTGVRALVGESFAEIFAGNCTALGIPAVCLSHEEAEALMGLVQNDPSTSITIDLVGGTVRASGLTFQIDMPASYRQSLVDGSWDTTATLLGNIEAIHKTAAKLPRLVAH